MKTIICHCEQCLLTRKRTSKRKRVQTYQVRAARAKVKQQIKNWEFDTLMDKVVVDYYA